MSKKKWMTGGGAVCGITVAVLMVIPLTRHFIVGTLRNEPKQDDKFMSEWVDTLGSEDRETRYRATAALSQMIGEAHPALPVLCEVLSNDPDEKVRSGAAFAIYKIASDLKNRGVHAKEAIPALTTALKDPDGITRMNASLALLMMEEDARSALPELEEAIERKENNKRVLLFTQTIREQMMAVFGSMGPAAKDAVPFLEKWLDDDEATTRLMAIRMLGKIGPEAKHALPLLLQTLDDEGEADRFRDAVREAIQLIDPATAAKMTQK